MPLPLRSGPSLLATCWKSYLSTDYCQPICDKQIGRFDIGRESLVRIPTLEPTRGTKSHVGALLDAAADATELVDALTRK